jgi:hypothetical protein
VVLSQKGLKATARQVGYVSKNSVCQSFDNWDEANDLSWQIGNVFQEAPSDGISEEPNTREAEG